MSPYKMTIYGTITLDKGYINYYLHYSEIILLRERKLNLKVSILVSLAYNYQRFHQLDWTK